MHSTFTAQPSKLSSGVTTAVVALLVDSPGRIASHCVSGTAQHSTAQHSSSSPELMLWG